MAVVLYDFAKTSGFTVSAINSILTLSMQDNNGRCTEEEIPPAPIIPTFISDNYLPISNSCYNPFKLFWK